MRSWKHRVNVAQAFQSDDLTFEQRRDHCVQQLRTLSFWPKDLYELARADESTLRLWDLVDELADTDEEDWFNSVWNQVYDWADANDVWIETKRIPA